MRFDDDLKPFIKNKKKKKNKGHSLVYSVAVIIRVIVFHHLFSNGARI